MKPSRRAVRKRQFEPVVAVALEAKEKITMGMMPENRSRRWSSVFRRYGIADSTDAKEEMPADPASLKEKAGEILLPEGLSKASKPKGARNPRPR